MDKEKREFLRNLTNWQRRLPIIKKEIDGLLQKIKDSIKDLIQPSLFDITIEFENYLNDIAGCRESIRTYLDELGTDPPLSVDLSIKEQAFFDNYLTQRENLEKGWNKELNQLSVQLEKIIKKHKQTFERIKRIKEVLEKNRHGYTVKIETEFQKFKKAGERIINTDACSWLKEQLNELEEMFLSEVGTGNPAEIIKDESGTKLQLMYNVINKQEKKIREEYIPFWQHAIKQLQSIDTSEYGEIALGNINRELERMREENENLAGLAQLGLIVESLDHEFHKLFSDLNSNFKELRKQYPDHFTKNGVLYNIENNFLTLELKLAFFSPLYRKKLAKNEEITGKEIKEFIDRLFVTKFEDHVNIIYTTKFINRVFTGVNKPILLAAIANIFHNSLYWITKSNMKPEIKFSVVPYGIVVSDSGPGIAPRDREKVFEPFFSRKPYGRGLGLYITKMNFERSGLEIHVAEQVIKDALPGANFIITKKEGDL